jgi:hypothetical protein
MAAHVVAHLGGNGSHDALVLGKDCVFGTKVGKHCSNSDSDSDYVSDSDSDIN